MALTAAQINQIAIILGVGKSVINAQITSLGTDFTAQDETDIIAQIALWDAGATTPFVKVHPMESNFGAETEVGSDQNSIIRAISTLLQFENVYSGSIGTIQIGL
jgi:hypothetical protein